MVLGSGIRDSRSGIQGSKCTQSRIPDPGSGSATLLQRRKEENLPENHTPFPMLNIFIKLFALMDLYRYLDRFTTQLVFSFNVVQYISMHIVRNCDTSVGAPIVSG